MRYTDINANHRHLGSQWLGMGHPITPDQFARAQSGDWQVPLTPTKPVPKVWFPPMKGCRVLGLAAGGGQQMPIFAALGADCTVLDYSKKAAGIRHMVAAREGYDIHIVRHDMTDPLPFDAAAFDLIFHPVSNCYIADVYPLWRECAGAACRRCVAVGAGHRAQLLFDEDETCLRYQLPFNPLKDPALYEKAWQKTPASIFPFPGGAD